ncbi:MAG: hypothetical protein WDM80_01410 [Limisphaerales bacterium]
MKIALLTTDSREHFRAYTRPAPSFGTAPEALLQGFARLPDVEVHVISCTQQPVVAPRKNRSQYFLSQSSRPQNGLDAHVLSRLRARNAQKIAATPAGYRSRAGDRKRLRVERDFFRIPECSHHPRQSAARRQIE